MLLTHHDNWLPGFSVDTDVTPIRDELARAVPSTQLVEIGYLDNDFNRNYVIRNKRTIAEVLVGGLQEYSNLIKGEYDGTER